MQVKVGVMVMVMCVFVCVCVQFKDGTVGVAFDDAGESTPR